MKSKNQTQSKNNNIDSKVSKGMDIAAGVGNIASSLINNFSGDDSIEEEKAQTLSNLKSISSKSALSSWVSDWTPQSTENMGLAGLSGAVTGATAGMAAGPWGALAGAVIGGATSVFGAQGRNNQIEDANFQIANAIKSQNNYLTEMQARDALGNIAAFGGWVSTHGGDYPTGFNSFKSGGAHEENLYGGIPQGVDQNGTHNLVEEGETKWGDYIFSKRLKVPKGFGKLYNLKNIDNSSYADASKRISKESEERPFDNISKRGRDEMLTRLQTAQEDQKYIDSMDTQLNKIFALNRLEDTIFAKGGNIHIAPSKKGTFTAAAKKYGLGVQEFARRVLANKEDYSSAMVKKANFARNAAKWHDDGGWIEKRVPFNDPYKGTFKAQNEAFKTDLKDIASKAASNDRSLPTFRKKKKPLSAIGLLAPVLGNIGNLITAAASTPERISLDRLDLTPYKRRRYLPYEPIDREYLENKYRAQTGAITRKIIDSSAGNPASARAALVAHNFNNINSLGDLYIKADEINRQRKERSIMFDAEQDRNLAALAMKEHQFNNLQKLREYEINAKNRAARRNAINQGLNTLGSNLAEISRYKLDSSAISNMFPMYNSWTGEWKGNTESEGESLFNPEIDTFLKTMKKGGK